MYSVNITDTAHHDLQNASLYISNTLNNSPAADRLLAAADKELSSFSHFPERNPLVKDTFLARNGVCMQMINNYLAFYAVHEESKTATILRIIHSRRDWIPVLKGDNSENNGSEDRE